MSALRPNKLSFVAVLLAIGGSLSIAPAASAITLTVDTAIDKNDGQCSLDCSLREAVIEANGNSGPDTIQFDPSLNGIPITLTLVGGDNTAELGDLDVLSAGGDLTISGNGQANTIIEAGTTATNGIDKIFSFGSAGPGIDVAVSGLTLRNGRNQEPLAADRHGGCFSFSGGSAPAGSLSLDNVTVMNCQTTGFLGNGGGGSINLLAGGTLSITDSIIQGNTSVRDGGGLDILCSLFGVASAVTISNTTISSNVATLDGGGIGAGSDCFGPVDYQMHDVTVSGNTATNGGGLFSELPWTIDSVGGPTTFSGNTASNTGGGIWLDHDSQTSNITQATITGNHAVNAGGGIRLDFSSENNLLNLSFSRISGNTAASGKASGLSVYNGTANAEDNWWGCSTGPGTGACDSVEVDPDAGDPSLNGTGTVDFNPWLRIVTTALDSTLTTNESTLLSASANLNSDNEDVSANNQVLRGLPVTWPAVGGSISGAQTTLQNSGLASATYTATAANVGNRVAAVIDNDGTTSGPNVAQLSVVAPPPADTTPPTLTNVNVSLNEGGRVGSAPVKLSWFASDNKTPASQLVFQVERREFVNGAWSAWQFVTQTTGTNPIYELPLWVPNQQRVRARDQANNWSPWSASWPITFVRRDEDQFTKVGTWSQVAAANAMRGGVARSTQVGATATVAFRGQQIALVMPTGPGRGTIQVCLDPGLAGQLCRSINLASMPSQTQRLVAVFSAPWGDHSLRVKVVSGVVDLDGAIFSK